MTTRSRLATANVPDRAVALPHKKAVDGPEAPPAKRLRAGDIPTVDFLRLRFILLGKLVLHYFKDSLRKIRASTCESKPIAGICSDSSLKCKLLLMDGCIRICAHQAWEYGEARKAEGVIRPTPLQIRVNAFSTPHNSSSPDSTCGSLASLAGHTSR